MMKRRRWMGVLILVAAIVPVVAWAQGSGGKPKRAKLPKFEAKDLDGVFFDNVFEKLVGARPATGGKTVPRPTPGGAPGEPVGPTGGGGGVFAWSKVISRDTLEDEIKSLNLSLQKFITTPGKFAGSGHKVAQKQFSLLALLFAITGEYDGDVRWKREAPTVREMFARAAANTKAGGNIQVYNEAKARRDDLAELVRGGQLTLREAEAAANWENVAGRSPLMKLLEERLGPALQQATASEAEFKKDPGKLVRDAELVAAIGEALTKEGMDDGDDEDYAGYAKQMRDAARDIVDAVKLKNAEQARSASGKVTQACSQCHEFYR